jgi:hypothetical protein
MTGELVEFSNPDVLGFGVICLEHYLLVFYFDGENVAFGFGG